MTETQLVDRFTRAWAKKEGFFDSKRVPTVAQRLNNPCNLPHWKDRDGNPYPEVCGAVQFPDVETGWRAARAQTKINALKRRLTFLEFFAGKPGVYRGACPRDDARKMDPVAYARTVASAVAPGTAINVVIVSLVVPDGEPV